MSISKDFSEFRTGWPVVLSAMLGIGLGLSPLPFYTLGMLAPELAKAFGWGFGAIQAGILFSTAAVLVAAPVVGWIADRVGARVVALVSLPAFSLSFMLFGLSNGDLIQYFATWALVGVTGAGTLPMTWTRPVNNCFEIRKGLALGVSLFGTGLFGFGIKPITAWLLVSYGWRLTYVAIGALPLTIAWPIAWICFRDRDPGARATTVHPGVATPVTGPSGVSFAEALRDWRFWLIALAFLPVSFGVGGSIPNMENILKHAGFNPASVVSLVQIIGLSVVAGRLLGGWLMDRFWAPAVAFVLLCAPAISCWFLAQQSLDTTHAVLAIVLIGLAAGVEFDLMAFLVARYFGMKSYAMIYSVVYGFFALGAGAAPLVYGLVVDSAETYRPILLVSSALFILSGSLLLCLGRYRDFGATSSAKAIGHAEAIADISPA